jgi:hypothetical protein
MIHAGLQRMKVQFTVQASLSAMGVGYQPEGLLLTIFLFLFHVQLALVIKSILYLLPV